MESLVAQIGTCIGQKKGLNSSILLRWPDWDSKICLLCCRCSWSVPSGNWSIFRGNRSINRFFERNIGWWSSLWRIHRNDRLIIFGRLTSSIYSLWNQDWRWIVWSFTTNVRLLNKGCNLVKRVIMCFINPLTHSKFKQFARCCNSWSSRQ